MVLFLFSLIGIPLTAGFTGKFLLFFGAMAVPRAGRSGDAGTGRLFRVLALLGVLNAAIGGWYYLRIVAVMYLRNPVRPVETRRRPATLAAVAVCAVLTIALGVPPRPSGSGWSARPARRCQEARRAKGRKEPQRHRDTEKTERAESKAIHRLVCASSFSFRLLCVSVPLWFLLSRNHKVAGVSHGSRTRSAGPVRGQQVGRGPAPTALLKRVEKWVIAHAGAPLTAREVGKGHEGKPALFLKLHPAAEPVEVAVTGKGRWSFRRRLRPGPGYHAYLCDLLKRPGKSLRVTWDPPEEEGDEGTRYFHAGDRAALEGEMLEWLGDIAATVQENVGRGGGWYSVSMPLGHHYETGGQVVTPLGSTARPGSRPSPPTRVRASTSSPGGTRGSGRHTSSSGPLSNVGRGALAAADRRRGNRPLRKRDRPAAGGPRPRPETGLSVARMAEMNGHYAKTGRALTKGPLAAAVARRAAKGKAGPQVGYRRRPVRVEFPDRWSLTIPGSFSEGSGRTSRESSATSGRGTRPVPAVGGSPPAAPPSPSRPGARPRRPGGLSSARGRFSRNGRSFPAILATESPVSGRGRGPPAAGRSRFRKGRFPRRRSAAATHLGPH